MGDFKGIQRKDSDPSSTSSHLLDLCSAGSQTSAIAMVHGPAADGNFQPSFSPPGHTNPVCFMNSNSISHLHLTRDAIHRDGFLKHGAQKVCVCFYSELF